MNKILISLSIMFISFFATAQDDTFDYTKDFDSILQQSKDAASKFFYPKLNGRFQKNDSTLTNQEVLALMIGFTENENYKPYQNVSKEREILRLISDGKYEEALTKSNSLLETNPLNNTALMEKGFALWKLEDENFEDTKFKYLKILDAIFSSGDGSMENAFFVLSPIDGQTIIKYVWQGSIGMMGSGSDENGNFLDILEMEKDGEKMNIYFNIEHAMKNSELNEKLNNAIDLEKEPIKSTLDSLTNVLIGNWEIEKIIDKNNKEIQTITRKMKGSPIGDEIKIKATGPSIFLKKDDTYELRFTPKNIDTGNWFLENPTSLVFQLITEKGSGSYKMLKSAAEMFGKKLDYDTDGNIVENNSREIVELTEDKMILRYEMDYFQVYKKKK